MVKSIGLLVILWVAAVAFAPGAAQAPQAASPEARPGAVTPQQVRTAAAAPGGDAALLKQYCMTCHNDRVKSGAFSLEGLDVAQAGAHGETWEKVVRKVRTGMMPPSGVPRPPREALDAFAASLESRLDAAADPAASLATPALHRLNRSEYGNAIRDLLALDVNIAPLLPADASSEGFDNVAEALGNSPSLIQGYVSAAMKLSRLAVGDRTMAPAVVTYAAPPGLVHDRHVDGLPLGTRGGMLITHTFPLDAEYEFTFGGGRGAGPGGNVSFTIDGTRIEQNTRPLRIKVTAGPHTIGLAAIDRQRGAGVDDAYSDFRAADNGFTVGGGVGNLAIMGPLNPTGAGDTPSRRRIFVCTPSAAAEEESCAKTILASLARRAYRGPVSDAEIATLMTFYKEGRAHGDFETGVQTALARILVAPRFVFRIEQEPAGAAAGSVYRISDVELASRLSFFLWSSIPDDELLETALKGRLHEPETLRRQVQRMLADKKADALIENFAGQWLYLRELATLQTEAPAFNENLRQAFRRETELLFSTIVREDRSIVELIDADYTFVNDRLAEHYGIANVRGSHFRKVMLPPASPRRGLLGQGSMLTVTSVATRTSPVMRGKWILENLLGAPPPEPPPGVETNLGEGEPVEKTTTLRQRLEMHRANQVCASCHRIMDPVGFALENFDLIGAWREKDGPAPVDSRGQRADGTAVSGPADLRDALLSRSEMVVTTAAEKMLIYALGRPVHYYDMPAVRAIVRRAAREDYRFSALVMGIVESDALQKRVRQ